MRPFLLKLVSTFLILIGISCAAVGESATNQARLIRRVFLDVRHVPPSPNELIWYLDYNDNPYITAVEWVVNNSNTTLTKEYLLSTKYQENPPTDIDQSMLDFIIIYQSGNVNNTLEEASIKLINSAMVSGDNKTIDVIDYISLCLTARVTNVTETNDLLSIFKLYPLEEEGYMAVLKAIKTYKDYKTK